MSSRNATLGIVVGIDDSPAARVAVQWAARDAELRNIPLTLGTRFHRRFRLGRRRRRPSG
jgi:nucleotide-binding universal stress UspA family protein